MPKKNTSLSKGGMYYLIYNILNMAFPFASGIYVARKLLPDSIGLVTGAQNLSQYFVIFAFLGIPTYGMREISKARNNREELNKVFSELYVINLCSTLIFSLLYLVLISIVYEYRDNFLLYLIVGISIALNALNISWLYEGLEEFKFVSIRNLIFKLVAFGFLVVLVRNKEDYLKYAMINVIGVAGNYIVNILYAPRFVSFSKIHLNLRRHMRPILLLVAVNLAIEIYSLMDVTMMNFLCSKESIAYYKYGHTIQKMLLQVVNTFTMVLVPRISLYYRENRIDDFNRLISKALKLILLCSVPMIVGIYFTADFLIIKLYGYQYINSAVILKLFSVLLIISPVGYLLGSRILLVTNHENLMLVSVGIGALANLIGNSVLIPLFSEFGATVASIVSEVVVMIVYINLGKVYFKLMGVKLSAIKVIISSLLMGLYLYVCRLLPIAGWTELIIQVFGSIMLYPVMLLALKEEVSREYFAIFHRKIKRRINSHSY